MKKIRTYGFWVALSGAIVMLVNALGRAFGFEIEDKLVSDIILAFAGVLVVFGIVIMPQKEENDKVDDVQEVEQDKIEEQKDDNQDEAKKWYNKKTLGVFSSVFLFN